MIRVLYRWRVDPDRYEEFARWWHEGTLRIRSVQPGAMGSTLCRPMPPTDRVAAIARWRSLEDLERFWQSPGGAGFEWAELEEVEVVDEVDHLTTEL
jgi:heme-degrading monooxygenase HmoA